MTDFIINGLTGVANLEPGTYQLFTTGNADEPWGGPVPGTTFTVAAPAAPATGGGTPGASAYDVACTNGFVGSQVQWLASLKGEPGTNATGGTVASQGDFTAAVNAAFAADTTLNWQGGNISLAAPIVLSLTQWKFAFGIRLNGAKIACGFSGQPAITVIVPVVNGAVIQNVGMRNFAMSDGHFTGGYGALRMECRTNGSWLGLGNIDNLTVDGHSGYAIELLGSVFEGDVSRVTTTNGLGAFHARVCGLVEPDPNGTDHDKGLPSALYITMPDFRDFTADAVLLSASTMYQEPFDLTVEGGYIVTGQGRAITAPAGITAVNGTGIENVRGDCAIVCGYRGGSFRRVRLANPVTQAQPYPLVHAALDNGTVLLEDCSVQNEGSGTNVALAHITGGGGKVYLNRSGPASGVTVDPGAATLTVAQYV